MGARDGATPASTPLRVLIVDDSRDDAELAEIALRDAGFELRTRVLYREPELRAALAEFAPDLVLCDMNLPGFSFEEALALVRAHDPALPVVCLTGAAPRRPPAGDGLVLKEALHALPGTVRGLLRR